MATGNNDYHFSMVEEGPAARLVVLGVGGMGNNAMENLARAVVPGLELYALNTDMQVLRCCCGSKPVQLGAKRTGGNGTGGDSDIGRMSAEDDVEKIRKIVHGAELVFIVAGLGCGTGSGAAPVVAQVCRESGVLTIGIVTMPMACEGPKREEKGENGLAELRKAVDSLLIIENDKLSAVVDKEEMPILEVFCKADKVVVGSVAAIARIINSHGYINLDLADLKNVLQRRGKDTCVDAYIGLGEASGPDRLSKASEIALNNPLLRINNIQGAANLLINVAGNEQIGHKEAMSAVQNVVDRVGGENQEIFMGVVTDNSMGDRLSVTVIATGLPARNKSPGKLKPVDCAVRRTFQSQGRDERPPSQLPIDFARTGGEHNSAADYAGAAVVPGFSNTSGFSPLVRKDDWLVPAYLRAKLLPADLDERLPESPVRKMPLRSKTVNMQPESAAENSQFREPLYHVAG